MNGLLLLDKPKGPTSHDMVNRVRLWTHIRRVGHAGTLDPLATGLLVILVGAATRLSEYMIGHSKRYYATVRLGETTETYDAGGKVVESQPVDVTRTDLEHALAGFRGTIEQRPPSYSAIKQSGQRAYARARKGEAVDLPPRPIEIFDLSLEDWRAPELVLGIHCSAGTYIRSLAHDLGQTLGCGGHLIALTRTAAGPFTLEQAHAPDTLEAAFAAGHGAAHLLPPDAGLADWPIVHLTPDAEKRVIHGNPVPLNDLSATGLGRAYNSQGQLVAIVEADPDKRHWQPRKVLVQA